MLMEGERLGKGRRESKRKNYSQLRKKWWKNPLGKDALMPNKKSRRCMDAFTVDNSEVTTTVHNDTKQ